RLSRLLLMSSVSSAVKPCGKSRLVSTLLPWITSLVRFVRPPGRETSVSGLRLRSKKVRLVRFEGRLKLVNRFSDRSRLLKPFRPAGKVRLVSRLASRLSVPSFNNPPGKEQLVSELMLRSRNVRLVNSLGRE